MNFVYRLKRLYRILSQNKQYKKEKSAIECASKYPTGHDFIMVKFDPYLRIKNIEYLCAENETTKELMLKEENEYEHRIQSFVPGKNGFSILVSGCACCGEMARKKAFVRVLKYLSEECKWDKIIGSYAIGDIMPFCPTPSTIRFGYEE